jgi:hypothetical protein
VEFGGPSNFPPKPSHIGHQITHANAEGLGNPHQGVDTYRLFPSFNLTKINRMQIGLFRQFFLGHFILFPMFSDGFPN